MKYNVGTGFELDAHEEILYRSSKPRKIVKDKIVAIIVRK
jgi:hypothetical protein